MLFEQAPDCPAYIQKRSKRTLPILKNIDDHYTSDCDLICFLLGLSSSIMIHTILLAALFACGQSASLEALTALSSERMIFQTEHGDIEMAFYPQVRGGRLSICMDT